MSIEIEKFWKIKADGDYLSVRELTDEQLRELDKKQELEQFPTLLEAVNKEIERRESERRIRERSDWIATQVVTFMEGHPGLTVDDVVAALRRLPKATATA